jgi:LPXTG-site transpeptidase (sortase) family protein
MVIYKNTPICYNISMNKQIKFFANLNIILGVVLLITPVFALVYHIFLAKPEEVNAQYNPEIENEIISQPIYPKVDFKDPFLDKDLGGIEPLDFVVPNYEAADIGTRIKIESIGLDTTVYESQDPSLGLGAGVWRDPLYGYPDRDNGRPVVFAGHRWGEDRFSWEYRFQNLFTKFDQLKGGEEIIVTWNNREYKYKIRKVEENTLVTDTADLILYTCIYYFSPERIFVYADLVE